MVFCFESSYLNLWKIGYYSLNKITWEGSTQTVDGAASEPALGAFLTAAALKASRSQDYE